MKIERFLDFLKPWNSSVSPFGPTHKGLDNPLRVSGEAKNLYEQSCL